ncbi:uncharacterized protein LOC123553525 [Mercenaria mercenaria]|uniref:uncharacterized protein LOC123553525 n=1 Tax=Mercenaria mercenaria TaxID=6596 RepID=UPI00234F083F|nr:uncharacterized protein LOC123553525 [Mercenaria mercenaria]
MAKIYGICFATLGLIVAFSFVHSQQTSSKSPLEKQLRANLTKLVQFVIHPTAKPSTELISHALAAGSIPTTEMERVAYLGILQRIARNTPELVKQFTTVTSNPDGAQTKSVDEIGLSSYVVMRALQYVQKEHNAIAARGNLSDIVNTASAASSVRNAATI